MSKGPLRPLNVEDLVGRDLTIEYHNAAGHRSMRTVAVKYIEISGSGNVSLKAYCKGMKGLRTFRLDRIVNFVSKTGDRYHAPPLVNPLIQTVRTKPHDGGAVRDLRKARQFPEVVGRDGLPGRGGFRRYGRGSARWWQTPLIVGGSIAVLVALSVLDKQSLLPDNVANIIRTGTDSASTTKASGDAFSGTVTRVVDGDTFWISSQDVSIRVWGLDAPEWNEPGGSEATAALTRLISDQTLECRKRDIDKYDRIVGQCFLPEGRDITAAMIDSGNATEYCFFYRNYYGTC